MLLEAQYTTQLSAPDQLHAPTQKQYAKKVFELIDNNDIYKIVGSVARNSNSKQYVYLEGGAQPHYIVNGDPDIMLGEVAKGGDTGTTGNVGEYLTGEVCCLDGIKLAGDVEHDKYSNLNLETRQAGGVRIANIAGKPSGGFKGADVWLVKSGKDRRFDEVPLTGDPGNLTLDFSDYGTFVSAKASRINSKEGNISTQKPSLSATDQEDVANLILFFWLSHNATANAIAARLVPTTGMRMRKIKNIMTQAEAGLEALVLNPKLYSNIDLDRDRIVNKADQFKGYTGAGNAAVKICRELGIKTIKMRFDAINICGIATCAASDLIKPDFNNPIAKQVGYSVVVQSKGTNSTITLTVPTTGTDFYYADAVGMASETYSKNLAALHTTDFKHDPDKIIDEIFYADIKVTTGALGAPAATTGRSLEGIPGMAPAGTSGGANSDAAIEIAKKYYDKDQNPISGVANPLGQVSYAQFLQRARSPIQIQLLQRLTSSITLAMENSQNPTSQDRITILTSQISEDVQSITNYNNLIDVELSNQNPHIDNANSSIAKQAQTRIAVLRPLKRKASKLEKKMLDVQTVLTNSGAAQAVMVNFLENVNDKMLDAIDTNAAALTQRTETSLSQVQQNLTAAAALSNTLPTEVVSAIFGELVQTGDGPGSSMLDYLINVKRRIKFLMGKVSRSVTSPSTTSPNISQIANRSLLEILAFMYPSHQFPTATDLINLSNSLVTADQAKAQKITKTINLIVTILKEQYNILLLTAAFMRPPLLSYAEWNNNKGKMGLFLENVQTSEDSPGSLIVMITQIKNSIDTLLEFAELLASPVISAVAEPDVNKKLDVDFSDIPARKSFNDIPDTQYKEMLPSFMASQRMPDASMTAASMSEVNLYESILCDLMKASAKNK